MKKKSVLLGLSGGIDSFVSALLLKDCGYSVSALWVDMLGCGQQRADVEALCCKLGIELHIADCRELFDREVIQKVLDSHTAGKTPSPCTICNDKVKFRTLWHKAQELGFDNIATGHYVNITTHNSRHYIKKGVDPIKDQSYYLWALGTAQQMLCRTLTPLGGLTKVEVREIARQRGFEELTKKAESQSVCFARGGYGDFLRRNLILRSGNVVNCSGEVIGTHQGVPLYTIGQKRGFELNRDTSTHLKVEVRGVDAANNSIEVGEPLRVKEIMVQEWWFSPFDSALPITAKIRGLGINPQQGVEVVNEGGKLLSIRLCSEEFWAPASGQPVVLFQDGCVVGGGVLCATETLAKN